MFSSWELATLALLALLIFGPERLPGMARSAGKTISRLRREASSTLDELKRASEVEELRRTAGVDELHGIADELRAEAKSLRVEAEPSTPAMSRPEAPAPFDPDAT